MDEPATSSLPVSRSRFVRICRYRPPARLALCALFAVVLTALLVQYSFRHGRLIMYPGYDDVGYLEDAARRLTTLYLHRFPAFYEYYCSIPPHSPYSSLLAMTGFMLFGIEPWAPYVVNVLLALVYFVFADHLLRGLPIWQRAMGMLFLVLIPLTSQATSEFRPDHACSLFTMIGCILLLELPLARAGVGRLALIGVAFGLALLAKPPTFPATILLLPACLALATVSQVLLDRPRRSAIRWRRLARAWAIPIAIAVLVALPHYLVAWNRIVGYIDYIVFGEGAKIWRLNADFSVHALYYLDGPGAATQFGQMRPFLAFVLLLAIVFFCLRRRRSQVARLLVFFCLLAGTWLMATTNPVKSIFFGLNFQTALVLLAVLAIGSLLRAERMLRHPIRRLRPISAALGVVLVMMLWNFTWPVRYGDYFAEMAVNRRQIVSDIYAGILARNPRPGALILIEGISDVNAPLMNFLALRDLRALEFHIPHDSDDVRHHVPLWKNYDFIILAETRTQVTADFLHTYRVLDRLLEEIRKRPQWVHVSYHVYRPSGRGLHLFELDRSQPYVDPPLE